MAHWSGRQLLKFGCLLLAFALLTEGLELDAETVDEDRRVAEQAQPQKLQSSNVQAYWLAGGGGAVALALASRYWSVLPETAKVVLACSVFMFVGPALVTLNKHIMQECDFPYALSLSSIGLLSSSIFAQALLQLKISELRPETVERMSGSNFFRIVGPLATARSFALASGNAVFLYLSLGFISMLKSFTPAMVLVVMTIAQVTPPVRPARWAVFVIVAGTAVTVQGELSFTMFGFLLMMASCVAEAINIVLNQKLLQNWSFSEVEAMYYVAFPSVLMLTFPAIFLEWESIWRNQRYLVFVEHPFLMISNGVLGTGVNFVTLGVIRLSSSMTVKVLNTFRCILLVAIGVVFYGETHSFRQLCGYSLSLVGFVAYNFFQVKKDKARELEDWVDSYLCPPASTKGVDDDMADSEENVLVDDRPGDAEEGNLEGYAEDSTAKPQVVGKFLES